MGIKGKCAFAGLGMTAMGKIYGRSSTDFAAEAIQLALDDAGLQKAEVDGLLINANLSSEMSPQTQMALGFQDLALFNVWYVLYGKAFYALPYNTYHTSISYNFSRGQDSRLPTLWHQQASPW